MSNKVHSKTVKPCRLFVLPLYTFFFFSRANKTPVFITHPKFIKLSFSFIFSQVTRNVMKAALALPPGDIYNLTVTACTERSRNTSIPHILKLGACLTFDLSATSTCFFFFFPVRLLAVLKTCIISSDCFSTTTKKRDIRSNYAWYRYIDR